MPPFIDRAIPVSDLELRLSRLGRGERLITWSRVALAAFSLLAVWLDPAEPARYARIAYTLLAAYVAYALVIALIFARAGRPLPRGRIVTHVLDLAVAVAINALTGAGSPFFVLFIFLLVAATTRWQWKGTLWTGAAALAAYLALGVFGFEGVGHPSFELNRFIVRGAYIAVVAVLLGTLGTWEERLRRDLLSLAGSPHQTHDSLDAVARESLERAAGVLRSPRLMLAWEESEEPWLETLLWKDGESVQTRYGPGVLSPLVADTLRDSAFLCLDLTAKTPTLLRTGDEGLLVWRGHPLHPELSRSVGARSVLSVPVMGEGVDARLFAFDKARLTEDDLAVGLILGRQIAGALEQHVLVRETTISAARAERVRLARELHDGIAQSLAGAALQLGGLRSTIVADPRLAQARLDEIERLLVDEQREVRLLMQELRPSAAIAERDGMVRARLEELCHRVSSLWGLEVELEVSGEVGGPMAREVYRLVQEALVNAARHAHAERVDVCVVLEPDFSRLRIADDGHGFPFQGVKDLAALDAGGIGPVSLKERVASLRGDLRVRSSDSGAVIEITLPARSEQVSV
ncbi:MAG TPA: sensor histidine kinase [Thermoanaerobaculia bacterium]|nr:sensor histidine kinase [Thermoanaerobaculia bacterium]